MRFVALLLLALLHPPHALSASPHVVKGYITCPSHYYYNVEPAGSPTDIHHRGLLDTLQKVADSYRVTLAAVQEYNPLAVNLVRLPIGMSICIPNRVYIE